MEAMKLPVGLVAACWIALLAISGAQAADDPRKRGMSPSQKIMGQQGAPLYRPPAKGAPSTRVGSGTRGVDNSETVLPTIAVLAPDHVALTATRQPTLYWFISDAYPRDIEVTITGETDIEPLLEVNLGAAEKAGIHSLSLADYDVELEPGKEYRWFVGLVVNPEARSQDHGMGSALTVAEEAPSISADTTLEEGVALAEAGLWHDAIDVLSRAIEQTPEDEQLHQARAALLEQVELQVVADYDLAQ